jgi:hypothetical protein
MEEQYQELAKYIGGFYPDMDVETIRKSLIEDPDKLDRAIKKLHQDKNRNWDYDEFKQAYISQYGQKKKRWWQRIFNWTRKRKCQCPRCGHAF